jgi:hypothetical protein
MILRGRLLALPGGPSRLIRHPLCPRCTGLVEAATGKLCGHAFPVSAASYIIGRLNAGESDIASVGSTGHGESRLLQARDAFEGLAHVNRLAQIHNVSRIFVWTLYFLLAGAAAAFQDSAVQVELLAKSVASWNGSPLPR